MAKSNIYRDGKIHVCAHMCSTCIFRPDTEFAASREKMIQKSIKAQSAIICHSTLGTPHHAVCRGFYNHYTTAPLALTRAMHLITEVAVK